MWLVSHVAVPRPAAAALIRPLPWDLPYAIGAALKSKRKEKKKFLNVAKAFQVTITYAKQDTEKKLTLNKQMSGKYN